MPWLSQWGPGMLVLRNITSAEEWIEKIWYIYIVEYFLALKKNIIMTFEAMWMDLGLSY